MFDIAKGESRALAITLDSDLDQMRERWVEKPLDWVTSAHLSPDGEKVALTARGRVFVVPHRQGRIVDAFRDDTVRYRDARFVKDGDSLLTLSDKSGEVEVWKMPANGLGTSEQLTNGSRVLKWGSFPSPDGKFIIHHNKDHQLWVYSSESKTDTKIDSSILGDFGDFAWSGDSQWLAYTSPAANEYTQIRLWRVPQTGDAPGVVSAPVVVTSDRYYSYSPAWSADGQWLFFLSDRTFRTVVGSPWGAYQPDPYLDETTKIYALALKPGLRWPYLPKDELQAAKDKADKEKDKDKEKEKDKAKETDPPKPADKADEKKDDATKDQPDAKDAKKDEPKKDDAKKDEKKDAKPKKVEIDLNGLNERLFEVPLKAGNYSNLTANDKGLFLETTYGGLSRKNDLAAFEIKSESPEFKTVISDAGSYEMSQDGKKLLVRKGEAFYIIDAAVAPASDLEKKSVNLAGWTLNLIPRQQWRQMFIESWRLMRDYFYDPAMHGVDWRAMLDKYLPLVDRVTTRAELSDVIAQMVGELSALHHFVRGGDLRTGRDEIAFGNLGGVLVRDEAAGGWRITRIYQCEPDDPQRVSPLAKPEVACKVGDVIESIDGIATLSVPDYQQLLRAKAGRQVLIRVRPAKTGGGEGSGFDAQRDAIIVPISKGADSDLRYTDWEYSRRLLVEKLSGGRIGYLHLRAMGSGDWSNFVKGYYPVFNREGLLLDVRYNRGGNIDSWVLSKLLRKQWAAWTGRVANPPQWNMQYAFRGHMAALCNEGTSSDGETFCEGMRRLNLGKVIGTRTWGGGIWLSSSNTLVDRGLASASEFAVFGPEGDWLVEGKGFSPDITVDNGPNATFEGDDQQLKAGVEHLLKLMADKPVPPLTPPARPNKSSPDNAKK